MDLYFQILYQRLKMDKNIIDHRQHYEINLYIIIYI
jgi:hypothetical protein